MVIPWLPRASQIGQLLTNLPWTLNYLLTSMRRPSKCVHTKPSWERKAPPKGGGSGSKSAARPPVCLRKRSFWSRLGRRNFDTHAAFGGMWSTPGKGDSFAGRRKVCHSQIRNSPERGNSLETGFFGFFFFWVAPAAFFLRRRPFFPFCCSHLQSALLFRLLLWFWPCLLLLFADRCTNNNWQKQQAHARTHRRFSRASHTGTRTRANKHTNTHTRAEGLWLWTSSFFFFQLSFALPFLLLCLLSNLGFCV